MVDSYTQYLQWARKTLSGLADFPLRRKLPTFTPLTVGQEDMEEHHEYKWYKEIEPVLTNTPTMHPICCLEFVNETSS